nr:MAG TPA: hypothetical protein [Caudoviricetes sp.]
MNPRQFGNPLIVRRLLLPGMLKGGRLYPVCQRAKRRME